MIKNKDLWDISNRPSTKTKLEILREVFDIYLKIWNKQDWISNELYVMDLFAGRGKYIDEGNEVNGSPLFCFCSCYARRAGVQAAGRKRV